MTGVAPEGETGHAPTGIPAQPDEVAGETPGGVGGDAVQIAYLHGPRVSHSFHQSLMHLVAYDKTLGLDVIQSMPIAVQCSGPNSLVEGRNLAVSKFLDEGDQEWLFFIDTDMGFRPDSLDALLVAADPVERPIVGGLCFAMKHMGPDGKGGFNVRPVPTLFMWAKNEKQGFGFATRFIYPPEMMVQVAGTGAAFLLIHRSILEEIRKKEGDHWFDLIAYEDQTPVSEDLSFCYRVGQLQRPIFVHTGVKVSHHKDIWLDENSYVMPEQEPMGKMMAAARSENHSHHVVQLDKPCLGHPGSDRWTGGDKKDER